MSANSRGRIYDYRVREQIVRTGDPDLFPHLDIPRATALTWLRRGMPDVVWLDQPTATTLDCENEARVSSAAWAC